MNIFAASDGQFAPQPESSQNPDDAATECFSPRRMCGDCRSGAHVFTVTSEHFHHLTLARQRCSCRSCIGCQALGTVRVLTRMCWRGQHKG
jgi:hypothetical protein